MTDIPTHDVPLVRRIENALKGGWELGNFSLSRKELRLIFTALAAETLRVGETLRAGPISIDSTREGGMVTFTLDGKTPIEMTKEKAAAFAKMVRQAAIVAGWIPNPDGTLIEVNAKVDSGKVLVRFDLDDPPVAITAKKASEIGSAFVMGARAAGHRAEGVEIDFLGHSCGTCNEAHVDIRFAEALPGLFFNVERAESFRDQMTLAINAAKDAERHMKHGLN